MPYYLKKETISNLTKWLEHKIKRLPALAIYYRSNDRDEFEALFHAEYPFTVFMAMIVTEFINYIK